MSAALQDPSQPADAGLQALFAPRSIAIIGASADASRISGRVVANLKAAGFSGQIFPVNPKYEVLQELPCYPSIGKVPGPVDCVVLGVPSAAVPQALEECGQAGVRSAVVFSSGFAEIDAAGQAAQQQLVEIARRHGIRLLGPNCLGLINAETGLYATFSTTLANRPVRGGALAIQSQSGAVGSHLFVLARQRGIESSFVLATGNESDVAVADGIRFCAAQPGVRVQCIYLEGIRDLAGLEAALDQARAAGQICIVMKSGVSPIGAHAALAHTAAPANDDAAVQALLDRTGAIRADSLGAAIDWVQAALCPQLAEGLFSATPRLGIYTISGGVGGIMADVAAECGLPIEPLADDLQQSLREQMPLAGPRNPVDLTGQVSFDPSPLGARMIEATMQRADHDAIVCYFTNSPCMVAGPSPLRAALAELPARHPQRLFVMCSVVDAEVGQELVAAGWQVIAEPQAAIRFIDRVRRVAQHRAA